MAETPFQVDVLRARLRNLNSSQASITTMSLWIGHHHASIDRIARIWAQEVCKYNKGKSDWMLAMVYVANDVIQNSRKYKTSTVAKEFFPALRIAVEHINQNRRNLPDKVLNAVTRVIKILGERNVYNSKKVDELIALLNEGSPQKKPDPDARLLHQYETNIEERVKIRNKAFGGAINSLKVLLDPPSADSDTRQLIARFPEAIADPKNVCPATIEESKILMNKTIEAHKIVDGYAKKVREEKSQTRELQKQLTLLDSLLTIESRLDKDLMQKANSCLDLLKKKREKLAQQKELLPDDPTGASDPLPDSLFDDL